uniref:Putative nucleosome-binding factor spn pob3 subunit n=1 Tax=Anopheles marajoara TaxID=58244 RepID=A0A2M4BUC2_9DIPT
MDNENTASADALKTGEGEPKTEAALKTADQTNESNVDPKTEPASEVVGGGTSSEVKPKPPAQKSAPMKRKRKKPPKDVNAPKHPLTGYVRYMNEHRDAVRQKHPNLSHMDVTKLMAEDWSKLPEDKKKPYLEAAEADKERYNKEIQEYKLTKPANAQPKSNDATTSTASKENPVLQVPPPVVAPYVNGRPEQKVIRRGDYDIPIFTEDFLDHNKVIESELRTLRKSNIDYEQQNSVLEKHVENMENGIQKLDSESCALDARNAVLESYLQKLKTSLASAFQGFSLGGECRGARLENIDQYLADLHQMADSSTQGHTLNKAKDIIRKLDLQKLGQ